MAKVQIKFEKLTPFGGIFPIMEHFDALLAQTIDSTLDAENGGYPPTQNGDIRSLFWLFSLMALQN